MKSSTTTIIPIREKFTYTGAIFLSFVLHLIFGFIVVIVLSNNAKSSIKKRQVFSVTLEGGKSLGGISQAPKKEKIKEKKAKPPKKQVLKVEKKAPKKVIKKTVQKKIQKKKIIEKKKEVKKVIKKVKPQKKLIPKKVVPPKKPPQKKKEVKKISKKELEAKRKKERERKFQDILKKARDRYSGESSNAGKDGFGAAKIGKKNGMGGGRVTSIEFIAYRNALESHIKRGWSWLPGEKVFKAQVMMNLQMDGVVKNVKISRSSGNAHFDDSILRAVYKSSPVPPPPKDLYNQFREVRITFNSHE